MTSLNLPELLAKVTEVVERAGVLLSEEWHRSDGPRGKGDKAAIDVEIERLLRPDLLNLFNCDFWGEETEHVLTGHAWCWPSFACHESQVWVESRLSRPTTLDP